MLGLKSDNLLNRVGRVCLGIILAGLSGCLTSMKSGDLEWVRAESDKPRVGNAYLIRGWVGMFSWGVDQLGEKITQEGVASGVFQHSQRDDLIATMSQRYKAARDPEPIILIGHSFGADDCLVIARELGKVGVPVDLIITLDCVYETTVPANVKLCYNYWQKGKFGEDSTFLRGIPLKQESGARGRLVNVNLLAEGQHLREPDTDHISIDKAPKIHAEILKHIASICPDRPVWVAMRPARQKTAAVAHHPPVDSSTARTAASNITGQTPTATTSP